MTIEEEIGKTHHCKTCGKGFRFRSGGYWDFCSDKCADAGPSTDYRVPTEEDLALIESWGSTKQ
jgi:hypothetical protein